MNTTIKNNRHAHSYNRPTPHLLGRFMRYRYEQGVGVYAVFEYGEFLIQMSPNLRHQQEREKKNWLACSKFIDRIFREKVKRQRPKITKENILHHVA